MIRLSTENKQDGNVAKQLESTSVQHMTEKSNRPTKVEMSEGILRCVKAWEVWPRFCKLLNCSQMPKANCFAYETW